MPEKEHANHCPSCSHVILTDSTSTGLRCGLSYFEQPVSSRVFQKLSRYPIVMQTNTCAFWKDRSLSLLDQYAMNHKPETP